MDNRKMIYLDDAIDALERKKDKTVKGDIAGFYNKIIQNDIDALMQLSSAHPDPSTGIQKILEYLDTTLHPIVSPDNWNVYCELYDMVSRLPSAQSEVDTSATGAVAMRRHL